MENPPVNPMTKARLVAVAGVMFRTTLSVHSNNSRSRAMLKVTRRWDIRPESGRSMVRFRLLALTFR